MTQSNGHIIVYVGTYTKGDSEGIYTCRLDPSTGELRLVGDAMPSANPSFLAVDSRRRFLYSVSEKSDASGGSTGSVSAFEISPDDERLVHLNTQPLGRRRALPSNRRRHRPPGARLQLQRRQRSRSFR